MNSRLLYIVSIFTFTLALASLSHAADSQTNISIPSSDPSATSSSASSTAGTSTANDIVKNNNLMEKMYLGLSSTFHGPSLNNLSSPYTTNKAGNIDSTGRGVNFDTTVTAAYLFTPTVGLGIDVPFYYHMTQGHDTILGDLGVRFFDKALYKDSSTTVQTAAIIQAPTSAYSRNNGQTLGLKIAPSIRHNFSDSRFAIGASTDAKAYLGVIRGKTFKLWAMPYVNYQLTPNLSLNVGYEMEAHHMRNASTFDFTSHQTDFTPGIIYMITPKIMVNPFLLVYTTDKIEMNHTGLGAVLSARL